MSPSDIELGETLTRQCLLVVIETPIIEGFLARSRVQRQFRVWPDDKEAGHQGKDHISNDLGGVALIEALGGDVAAATEAATVDRVAARPNARDSGDKGNHEQTAHECCPTSEKPNKQ